MARLISIMTSLLLCTIVTSCSTVVTGSGIPLPLYSQFCSANLAAPQGRVAAATAAAATVAFAH